MTMTSILQTDTIDLTPTHSSSLSKACRSEQQERRTPRNQFPWTKMVKGICRLAIALILLSPLTTVDLSHAAGRVFYDDFESGNTNKWQSSGTYCPATVAHTSPDGATPHSGSWGLLTNWDGT